MAEVTALDFNLLRQDIHAALRAWRQLDGTDNNLLVNLLLVQAQRQTLTDETPSSARLAANRVLLAGMRVLGKQDERAAQILQQRFLDGQTILWVGNALNLTADEVKKRQKKSIAQLTSIILEQETAVRHDRIQLLENSLEPPTYTTLFGIDDIRQKLVTQLLAPNSAWVTAVVGIGGIGKTALADKVVRDIIRHFHFEEIVWLRVGAATPGNSHSTLPQFTFDHLMSLLAQRLCPHMPPDAPAQQRDFLIRQTIKAAPYLIVIDNLEADLSQPFLAHLYDLTRPSKFLLTTRTRPPHQAGIFNLILPGLAAADVRQFVRSYAQEIGLRDINQAADADIQAIYDIVGGNPLALKLAVGLTAVLPLAQIRADLTQAQLNEVEAMYRHIYWQTWQTLADDSRTLLKAMPLTADSGGRPEQLLAISGLEEKQMWSAISELVHRSLLEVRGNAQSRRYGIHRLTDSFLKTEIIHWQE